MAWIAIGIGASSLIGGIGSYLGGKESSKAADKAAQAQLEGQKYVADLQQKQYEQTREDQEPWRIAGENALQAIQDTPDFEFTSDLFEQYKDPSYEWRVAEGTKAIDASASARGNLFSGAQGKKIAEYGQNMASQEYTNAFNRAKSVYDTNMNTDKALAGVGQQANNMVQQAGQNMANNISSNMTSTSNNLANIAMQNGTNQANMYGDFAQGTNQAIGNGLLAYKLS